MSVVPGTSGGISTDLAEFARVHLKADDIRPLDPDFYVLLMRWTILLLAGY
jgi:hypothetical protein